MPKILEVEVKKLKSKVAYRRNVSSDSLAAISVMLRNSTTHLEIDGRIVGEYEDASMDSKSVGKMKTT
jgi:hypothetical protein